MVVEVLAMVAVAHLLTTALFLLGPRHLCGQELVQPLQPRDEHVVVRALEPQRARVSAAP